MPYSITGSRIRAAVALITFDEFHKHSAEVIQHAIFRDPVTGKMMPELKFEVNNLVGYLRCPREEQSYQFVCFSVGIFGGNTLL